MKGLIRTIVIVAVLILVGVGASFLINRSLAQTVAAEREHGYMEGRDRGYQQGWQDGHKAGYQEGGRAGYLEGSGGDNASDEAGFYFIYNPTYNELEEMLVESKADSAEEIHEYAEGNGIRVAYVRCQLAREAAEGLVYVLHLVAFETVDKGLVIIEPWSYRAVKVEVGQSYSEQNGFNAPGYDDTITKVTIVW